MHAKKKFTFLTFCLLTIIFCGLSAFTVYPQQDTQGRVEPLMYNPDYVPSFPPSPDMYLYAGDLTGDETHIFDQLTSQQRQSIESQTNPPADGIVRDLENPIYFSASQMDIPSEGETSIAGGRLARVNEELLVWSTFIKAEGADRIRVYFKEGNFPAGVQVNLFAQEDFAFNQRELLGELGEYGFYTTPGTGDYVIIQVVIPIEAMEENLYFEIPRIVHAEERYMNPDALPLTCFQDVQCSYATGFSQIGIARGATARLNFVEGMYSYWCSGGVLNDNRSIDNQPFLLTANHCFSTQASAASLVSYWNYYNLNCNSNPNPNYYTINGFYPGTAE